MLLVNKDLTLLHSHKYFAILAWCEKCRPEMKKAVVNICTNQQHIKFASLLVGQSAHHLKTGKSLQDLICYFPRAPLHEENETQNPNETDYETFYETQ